MLAAARNHHRLKQVSRHAAAITSRSTCGGRAISTSSKTDQQEEKKKSTWTKMRLFLPPVLFFCAGTERALSLREKSELAEQWESRLKMEALEFDGCSSESNMEFRKVKCKGVFYEKKSILVVENTPTSSDPFAYEYSLLTPLIAHPQSVSSPVPVLVNRGRVPRDWADYRKIEKLQSHEIVRDFPQKEKLSSAVESVGFIRNIILKLHKHLTSSVSRPQPQPVEFVGVIRSGVYSEWLSMNVGTLVRAVGLQPEATLYVDQIEDISDGTNKLTTLYNDAHMLARFAKLRKEHIEMIVIWYCCSAGTLYLARWLMKRPF